MRCSSIFLIAVSLGLLSSAELFHSPYNIHEKRTRIPQGWSLTRRHNPTATIPLRFALKQRNIEEIENYLYDVSHPKSPNYGKHWTIRDVARTFAPTDETVDVVRNWLIASGIGEEQITLGRAKGWIQANVTIEEAEELVKTEYNVYTHTSGKKHVGCGAYSLPEHVQPHVDFITPSVHFDVKLTRRSSGESTSSARGIRRLGSVSDSETAGTISLTHGLEHCDDSTTPICVRTLYNLFYKPVATDKNSFGIVEYTPNTYMQSDLQMFAKNFSTDLIGKEPYLVSIDGGYAPTTNGTIVLNFESDLDLEYGMSLVTGNQTVTLYQVGDSVEGASENNFLDAIDGSYCTFDGGDDPLYDGVYPDTLSGGYKGPEACGTVKPTYVISTSYVNNEADFGPFYAERQCAEYAKLGLMGVTILYSSGDFGVAGFDGICLTSNHTQSRDGSIFSPSFPGTCPYVTSVGATMVKQNATVYDPEVVMMRPTIYSGGGGFSNYFGMPEYQKNAVDYYLTNYRPNYPSTIWNSTGMSRGYPIFQPMEQITLLPHLFNFLGTQSDGKFRYVSGTSCSCPVVGAILTMINDARLAIGKGPIGFINPTIYSPEFADAFNDITEGHNPGCGTAGYNASHGWDPLTGLGTPNFPKLLALWLSLP